MCAQEPLRVRLRSAPRRTHISSQESLRSKENAYIIAGIFAFFVLGYLIAKKEINATRSVDALLFALISFVIFALFYSNFLTNPDALISVIPDAINHWAEMHRIERIGGHWAFYLPILARYELLITILALAGGMYYVKKRNIFMIFLLYWGVTSLLVYSYLQEKVPWLVLHILLPFALIAGAYLGELLPSLGKRPRAIEAAVVITLVLSAGLFIHQSIFINHYENTDSDEIMIRGIPVHGLIYCHGTCGIARDAAILILFQSVQIPILSSFLRMMCIISRLTGDIRKRSSRCARDTIWRCIITTPNRSSSWWYAK